MLSFVQNWFSQRANPIGVDFGTDCLRLAQVQLVGNDYRLVAAASADVPAHVRHNPAARLAFFVETTRDLLAQSDFRGRQAVLALPASSAHIQHLRMAKMDDAETRKALPWEARGKIPIDPSGALLRHLIAGEVYQDQEPKNEVIVMAAAREFINELLASAAKAKLDVIGMNVEPKAIVDCFGHIYVRKVDQAATSCYLDIGLSATRVMIARGEQICFARVIPIGGDHFTQAVAHAMRITLDQAKLLRIQLAGLQSAAASARTESAADANDDEAADDSLPLLKAGLAAGGASDPAEKPDYVMVDENEQTPAALDPVLTEQTRQVQAVEQACAGPLSKLIGELDLCRRYYESTFPSFPVERLIFIGGEARQRGLCQQIACELGLPAQMGDPMVRMGRVSEVGIESGIDRREPQPGWTVAIGLSLGPVRVAQAAVA
jgi:type IV pilus assembly protein PilM